MKIKRYFAEDIRQAMRMVKEELGADAVIMSNRSVDGGVEIVAARDFDEELIHSSLQKQAEEQKLARSKEIRKPVLQTFEAEEKPLHVISSPRKKGADGEIPPRPSRRKMDEYLGYAEKANFTRPAKPVSYPEPLSAPKKAVKQDWEIPAESPKSGAPSAAQVNKSIDYAEKNQQHTIVHEKHEIAHDKLIMDMFQELKSLRVTMNSRLSEMGWQQNNQNNPARLELLSRLADMGIAKNLSIKVANRLGSLRDVDVAFKKAQEMLINVLPIAEDNLLEYGGIVALVGPTGVGKTTTIAKLAAQFILKHGPKQVALISTDNFRIAAHDQLNTYGRILDVPVRIASNAEQLRSLINGFADKRLILIDTAGMGHRDQRLAEQIKTLQHDDLFIKCYLVMSAATQYKTTKEIIEAFKIFQPEAGILTKLDETTSQGAALSAVTEQRLPLAFVTNGQQVPEDLHNAVGRDLVEQCVAELKLTGESKVSMNYDDWVSQSYA
ncbi:MAG: flagellar biosynthesis protein FlhF [Methylicorpusculum sp.]|uniref:flagellar biosynthesis protein FlhF n=1 Tax=Methylicorpusculum sp. TaxID=2713644 RepID=UPI00271ECCFE|nr:flagellar biosynthesis protein FlhF [Methylicorpusculum sp.]MDO8937840.1 flagellar biosynthesis protein FlhF [Methylicorpusculum sp.]MDP2178103.1 flagellar biosynthesis protein FlhF [Methylicorpusculum sp.]MDP2202573.1 flagellar biosynthesis protein FlhF [Methylicorpusculum sp.]